MKSGRYHYCPNPRPVNKERLAGVMMSLLENKSNIILRASEALMIN